MKPPSFNVLHSLIIHILIAVQNANSQVNRAVYNGSEILFFNTRKTYNASQTACQLISGDLVIIRNKALQDIITPYLDSNLPYWIGPWATGYWIGGRRQATVTDWKWRDGTPLPQPGSVDIYQNWIGVEPNGALGTTLCAAMTPYNYINPFNNIKGGWLDDDCTRTKYYICQRDLCAVRPCQNNGTCVAMETNYRCDCPPGYIGGNCEIDLCASNPCENEGTCNKIPANYTCSCVKGFSGQNCENDFCFPNRCQNNGTCIRKTNEYKCKCEPGYGGKNCRIDFCAENPCQNGGTCNKVKRNSTCSCLPGFSGRSCETEKFQDIGNGCAIHINKIPSQMKSYEEAKIQCNSLQAELAIIKSNQSNVIINQYNQLWMDSQPLWLGGRESNSSWKWLDGSNVDGFNTSTMTHDGCLSTAVNGSWSAENCTRRIGYACEKLVNGGDLCSSSKCKNGGNCTASGCHFYCNCPPGFAGLICEISNVNQTAPMNGKVGYVIPVAIAAPLVVLLIVGILVIKWRKDKNKDTTVSFAVTGNNDAASNEVIEADVEVVYSNVVTETGNESHAIVVKELPAIIHVLLKAKGNHSLGKQFDELKELTMRNDAYLTAALLPENKVKNRFKNIIPYDQTRVVLAEDGTRNDYINANYIDCYSTPKKYIATQGPLPRTEQDFWRMVWETESSVIVMLAKLVENGKKKCEKYWPDYNGTKSYPSMQVTCTQEEVFGCFTARSFTMARWGATRQITQFHYTTWPDHGVPITTSGLHAFKRAVLGKQQEFGRNKPIVVHCSAGAGRTGTFIAFDSLTMEMNQKDNVNVYQTVLGMRRQRVEMVQTEKQYMLLHKLVAEEYALGTTEVGFGNLGLRIKELERMQGYAREMEKLNSVVLREKHTIQHFRIMDDRFAPASKYNASFIESYDRTKTEMIAAEGPTEATIKGFWGAVLSNQVHTIVSLRSSSEETKHRCMPSLQMPTRNFDNFVVKLLTESDAGNDVTQRELHLSHGAGEQIEIGFYHFDNWLPNSIPSCGDVLELIKKTQKSKLHRSGKVLVYCSDGVGRTGVFFGVLNLIERAKLEGKIDVPWQVKDMREMRQGMVNAEVLYRFIYQCLVEFVSTFDVYSNSIGS